MTFPTLPGLSINDVWGATINQALADLNTRATTNTAAAADAAAAAAAAATAAANADADAALANAAAVDAQTQAAAKVPKVSGTPAKTLYTGPLDPGNGTTVAALTDGSVASPNTGTTYSTPVLYIERHTNNSTVTQYANWGNAYKQAPVLIEVVAYGAETGEVNGLAARVTSTAANPVTGAPLVGISALAQTDAAGGVRGRDCFGANFAVVANGGTPPTNFVGIEVDLVPQVAMTSSVRPGVATYQNYTGYMAQSAGGVGVPSNTGVWITTTDGVTPSLGPGWLYGIVAESWFASNIAYLRNTKSGAASKGVYIETQHSASAGRVLECFVGSSQEQFRVDGDSTNPVWVRRDGTLTNLSGFLLQDSSSVTGSNANFGTFRYSGNTDLPRLYGGGSAGGMFLYGTAGGAGTSGQFRFANNAADANNRAIIDTAAPTSGFTALHLAYHNGTSVAINQVKVGAADSGGAGFRTLTVPN